MACSISGTFCGNDAGFCLNRRKKDESAEYYSGNFNWYLVFIFCNYDNEERKQLWELQYLPGAGLLCLLQPGEKSIWKKEERNIRLF